MGGVISPLLANIYLHYVLDEWFEGVVKPRLRGEGYEIRYADDFLLCFQYREDAEKVFAVLGKAVRELRADAAPGQDAPDRGGARGGEEVGSGRGAEAWDL